MNKSKKYTDFMLNCTMKMYPFFIIIKCQSYVPVRVQYAELRMQRNRIINIFII
jgi:hypothetical protein